VSDERIGALKQRIDKATQDHATISAQLKMLEEQRDRILKQLSEAGYDVSQGIEGVKAARDEEQRLLDIEIADIDGHLMEAEQVIARIQEGDSEPVI
jgi:predicted  nucleic acid-binding Zn-ribbon protein